MKIDIFSIFKDKRNNKKKRKENGFQTSPLFDNMRQLNYF